MKPYGLFIVTECLEKISSISLGILDFDRKPLSVNLTSNY